MKFPLVPSGGECLVSCTHKLELWLVVGGWWLVVGDDFVC